VSCDPCGETNKLIISLSMNITLFARAVTVLGLVSDVTRILVITKEIN